MKLQMERDYGIYKSTAIKKEVLLYGDRYLRANESIGYEFDPHGLNMKPEPVSEESWYTQVFQVMEEKYESTGRLSYVQSRVKNWLNLESFRYYLQMPAYIYPNSPRITKLGFMTFVLNSVIVIGFAMVAQVFLCSICAFVISRQLSERAGKLVSVYEDLYAIVEAYYLADRPADIYR